MVAGGITVPVAAASEAIVPPLPAIAPAPVLTVGYASLALLLWGGVGVAVVLLLTRHRHATPPTVKAGRWLTHPGRFGIYRPLGRLISRVIPKPAGISSLRAWIDAHPP